MAIPAVVRAPIGGGAPPRTQIEKDARTEAQRKLDSQLLYEIYRRRGEAAQKGVPPGATDVKIDAHGRALVDVRAPVTARLQKAIRRAGGTVLSTSRAHDSTIARIPLLKLESIAADPAVRAIVPAAEGVTARELERGAR